VFFLTDVAAIPPVLAAWVFSVGRIWDAFSDPLMGHISDRTKSPWGRRRPYILFGAPFLGLSFILLWQQYNIEPTILKLLVYCGISILFFTSFTVVAVPYASLVPELTLDYDERTSFSGWKGASVHVDNAGGSAAITGHLLERNVTRLLFVQVQREHLGHEERGKAAQASWCSKRSVETFSFCYLDEMTDLQIREFTADAGGAIFCSNDDGALLVWQKLLSAGLKLPEQVRLAGFDGTLAAGAIGLTTVVFDGSALAEAGMNILLDKMAGRKTKAHRKIPARLRAGTTT